MSVQPLVFGRTGQVASALATARPNATFLRQTCADAIHAQKPDFVINAAAYTAVDKAEEEEDLAHAINAQAPKAMAQACAELDIPFIHISTDYVFDGSGTRPWQTTDPVAPLGAYGRTKLAGEQAILAAGGPNAILRTAWVFSETGNNFVKTMLRGTALARPRPLWSLPFHRQPSCKLGGIRPRDFRAGRACLRSQRYPLLSLSNTCKTPYELSVGLL